MTQPAPDFLLIQLFCYFNKRLATAVLGLIMALMLSTSVLAQETIPKEPPPSPQTSAASANDELTKLRKEVQQLSAQVNRLKAELAKLERYKSIDYTRELMLKEEQRVLELQKELIELGAKETALQKRLDEIEVEEQPDRIERSLAGFGSTKPEADREAISRRLSNEKRRIQTQMDTLRASRTRIPPLIVSAEESIARLKQRLVELRAPH